MLNAQSTPNPDSIKFSSEEVQFGETMHSFKSAQEAADHPMGHALFKIEGVANVFIVPDFVTVTKTPEADWDSILPAIKNAIETHL